MTIKGKVLLSVVCVFAVAFVIACCVDINRDFEVINSIENEQGKRIYTKNSEVTEAFNNNYDLIESLRAKVEEVGFKGGATVTVNNKEIIEYRSNFVDVPSSEIERLCKENGIDDIVYNIYNKTGFDHFYFYSIGLEDVIITQYNIYDWSIFGVIHSEYGKKKLKDNWSIYYDYNSKLDELQYYPDRRIHWYWLYNLIYK